MRLFLVVVMLFTFGYATAQKSQQVLLNEAFEEQSSKKIKLFFKRWARFSSSSVKSWAVPFNDTINAFNEVYRAYYLNCNPQLIQQVSKSKRKQSKRYIVLRERTTVDVTDTLPEAETGENNFAAVDYSVLENLSSKERNTSYTLRFYRPELGLRNVAVLYLTKSYYSLIEEFLTTKPAEPDSVYWQDAAAEGGHYEIKKDFLSTFIRMVRRHPPGVKWNYITYPAISSILFNRQLTYAAVSFSQSASAGMAYYKKMNGKWVLVDQRRLRMQ